VWNSYQTPASLDETLRLLAERGSAARIIAGGTDLLVELRRATGRGLDLIDVSRMDGLDEVWLDDDCMIHIGPAVTHNQAAASRIFAARGTPLSLASSQVGTPQVRNRGTIAGNLITASPANDTIAALWALDARLTISSVRGRRTLSFPEFYQGVRRTALSADEMVTDIVFPALDASQKGIFVRLGLRRANTIAMVNAALVLTFSGDTVIRARIALGSVAPTIIRAAEAEKALEGKRLSPECIAEAAGLSAHAAAPITDVRSGADYRREAVRILVGRALAALRDKEGEGTSPASVPRLWGGTDGRFQAWKGNTLCHRDNGTEPVECIVNGERVSVRGAGGKRLIDILRDDLALTGTKEGCGAGECGACTIRMDGISVLACLVPAPRAHGTEIVTVEGLARGGELHPLQQAFIDEGAVQCGFCTPGFIMAGASLLEEIPHPSCGQITSGLSGNLCRCTGYYSIMRAVERAAVGRGDL
jgi:carbon-monoxide dehydrogenase medium subunit